MKFIFQNEISGRYTLSTKSKNYYVLSNSEKINIYYLKTNELAVSIVNFFNPETILLSKNERYLICINSDNIILSYDLNLKKENYYFINSEILINSIFITKDNKQIKIIYNDSLHTTKIITLGIQKLNLIEVNIINENITSALYLEDKDIYIMVNKDNTIYHLDDNFNINKRISFLSNDEIIESIYTYHKGYIIQTKDMVYLLDDKDEIINKISLVDNSSSNIFTIQKQFKDDLFVFSSKIDKNNILFSFIDNLSCTSPILKIFDINKYLLIDEIRFHSSINSILLLEKKLIICGSEGTYLFKYINQL